MTIKLTMYCFLVHFTADNIFVFNFKSRYLQNYTMGVTWFLVQELLKPFSRTSLFSFMKFAVRRAIRGKNHQLSWYFKCFFLSLFEVFFCQNPWLLFFLTSFPGIYFSSKVIKIPDDYVGSDYVLQHIRCSRNSRSRLIVVLFFQKTGENIIYDKTW